MLSGEVGCVATPPPTVDFAEELANCCPPSPVNPLAALERSNFTKDRFDFCGLYSYDPGDLALVATFVELMGVRAEFSLTAALSVRFGASEAEVGSAVRLVLRCLRLLHLCGYPRSDIEVMVAHASAYLKELLTNMSQHGQPKTSLNELSNIFCLLMYLAHSYVEDQNCPLATWHQHLFRRYCDLATLNSAVLSLLEQLAFVLRIDPGDLAKRLAFLQEGCAA